MRDGEGRQERGEERGDGKVIYHCERKGEAGREAARARHDQAKRVGLTAGLLREVVNRGRDNETR